MGKVKLPLKKKGGEKIGEKKDGIKRGRRTKMQRVKLALKMRGGEKIGEKKMVFRGEGERKWEG